MTSPPATVIAFFPDRRAAAGALARARRAGYGHSAAPAPSGSHAKWERSAGARPWDGKLAAYGGWAFPDESLVVVRSAAGRVADVLAVLRQDTASEPATFVQWGQRTRGAADGPGGGPPATRRPTRFTSEPLLERAARLSSSQQTRLPLVRPGRERRLWNGLRRSARAIAEITEDLSHAARADQTVSLAGQWLLDNAHTIRREVEDVRRNFSRELYDALPVLAEGPYAGEPRVYELSHELVSHAEAHVEMPDVVEFLRAYSARQPLTIAELWAMPLSIRLALIEHLALSAEETHWAQRERARADLWANRLLAALPRDPGQLPLLVAALVQDVPDPGPAFVERLVRQLQGEPLALDPLRGWIERKLAATIQDSARAEQQRQATDHVMVANIITSLRRLELTDWREVFEQVSPIDDVLRRDPAGVYQGMDFATRDAYRQAVEQIARWAACPEVDVAGRALAAAAECRPADASHTPMGAGTLASHVGYHLIGDGRAQLEAGSGCVVPRGERLRRLARGWPAPIFIGGVALVSAAVLWAFTSIALGTTSGLALAGVLLCLLAALPASEIAVQFVNLMVVRFMPARVLPKLSFEDGIPDEWRTLVVVPMLLSDADVADELQRLEIRYLGNRDANLRFALLADLRDAPRQETDADASLLAAAVAGIEQLNSRYATRQFCLFHRPRLWSESEQTWMGWERKRGKLEELNRFLTGADTTTFHHTGDAEQLRGVRFVITLDSDSQLPHGAARRLVGTLAHPLNRPVLGADGETIAGGYTIIQPRVTTSLSSANASRFSRAFNDPVGLDPYTRAVSDVYQDLAGEGSYHGKGIYDLQAFHTVLDRRFPDALLLSHDLLEGAHVRVGLATDVELLDQFPATYAGYADRDHRWIRGDWQVAGWCLPRVPTADGGWTRNPLSALNRWKVFDNLRRSLVPVALVGLLVGGWLLVPQLAWLSTALAGITLTMPPALALFRWVLSQPGIAATPWEGAGDWREHGAGWLRAVLVGVFLPHRALIAADAIARVVYRRAVSRRSLLRWQTSGSHGSARDAGGRRVARQLSAIAVTAGALGAALIWTGGAALPAALPFVTLWALSPVVSIWMNGRRAGGAQRALQPADQAHLRRLARQTWRYFDDLLDERTSWLPPDNSQVALRAEVADRTSPTNIGLWLLSAVAAHDFGYLTIDQMVERAGGTLETLHRLERFEGHLFNWYDTSTLEPLPPRYISTVDSGNLLASLVALVQGVAQKIGEPVLGPQALRGLADALAALRAAPGAPEALRAAGARAGEALRSLEQIAGSPALTARQIVDGLRAAAPRAAGLAGMLADGEVGYWAGQVERQVAAHLDVVDRYLASCAPAGEAPSLTALAAGTIDDSHSAATGRPPDGTDAQAAARGRWLAGEMLARARHLIARTEQLCDGMSMRFLYDAGRDLFTVGYNVGERRADASYYDLLASESRLGSLFAIARGDVPVEHWLALGRTFGRAEGGPILLSWTGTMFEYLMPLLLTRGYDHSLLNEACRGAVAAQIAYGERRGVPWGISESAYSAVDARQIYQYHAFGVPGVGIQRGLEDDLVVAPYATALALMVAPRPAVMNLRRLELEGAGGTYGLCDSIDYTPRRLGPRERSVAVRTYMAHHQGMTLIAIDNALLDRAMQNRFHADPRIRAVESLLFERVPAARPVTDAAEAGAHVTRVDDVESPEPGRRFDGPDSPTPRVQLLGGDSYAVMLTSAGGGYSRWRGLDVGRWSADTTRDCWGTFIYLRDLDAGTTWSAAHQPVGRRATHYSALLEPGRVEFERRDREIGTRTEVTVSVEEDVEVWRVTLANFSRRTRRIEVTSYLELALAAHAADRAHPAFGKLFVQTEAVREGHALLARRKPRTDTDVAMWAGHVVALPPESVLDPVQFETNRGRFIGRGRSTRDPLALRGDLSNSAGYVLDPIFSVRARVSLEPGQRLQLAFTTVAGGDRAAVLALVEKYADLRAAGRAFDVAHSHAQLMPRQLLVTAADVRRFQRLASHVIFPSATLRASEQQLGSERVRRERLWSLGISGDLPIVLVQAGAGSDLELVRETLAAHTYWRLHGLRTDLVIVGEEPGGYERPVGEALERLVESGATPTGVDQPGGVFLRPRATISDDDFGALLAASHVVLVAARGRLAQQLAARPERPAPAPLVLGRQAPAEPSASLPFLELPYFNGFGGFTPDGREYAIYLGPETNTPAPWINVMANPRFGAIVSEAGQGTTWYGNSQSNRLLPWSNDPVVDPSGDAIYLRDEQSGLFWTPTASPVRERDAYRARHGQGYTVFEHNSHTIEQELTVSVPIDAAGGSPVRLQRLRLRNASSRRRRLSVTSYATWVLGTTHEETQSHVVSTWDAESGALFARNRFHPTYRECVAFCGATLPVASYTADRAEFLGRNGDPTHPAAMAAQSLSGRTGAGLDPCAALQVLVDLDPGQDAEVTFVLGQAASVEEARALLDRFGDGARAARALAATRDWWDGLLGTIQVETPDQAVNFLLNRWLPYQTLSCRIWGRSALYQSGGAYGFRDQLQDAMALVYADPALARELLLAAAAHQFAEGDVQHWWHAETGAGVRTRISDDLLWLPYVTAHYVRVTGDTGVLEARAPFLMGKCLEDDEHEAYFVPTTSAEDGTLLEHCRRAVAAGVTAGQNGLPLIGTGDWNDGLNLVGAGGKGESVWLAWFSIAVLNGFADLLDQSGEDGEREACACRERAVALAGAIETAAWDGEWYRRATYDDGTPLGSRDGDEAQIDSLPQSWAVLSGAAQPDRARRAVASADARLVRERDRLVLLFTPPFENPARDPGYIQGYPPGVRENGGQYTHAAIWLAMAQARLGDGDAAVRLLNLLNPVEHTRTPADVERYRAEPYVVAADVYALDGHVGQAGWTWYTGSSGWLYRAWLEEILGFTLRGGRLEMAPTLPSAWSGFSLRYVHRAAGRATLHVIRVEDPEHVGSGVLEVELDGRPMVGRGFPVQDDGATHHVTVRLGPL